MTGALRATILAKLGHPHDSDAKVRIIEGEIEGGWSEFTSEIDYDIEVWVDDPGQSQRVFGCTDYSRSAPMAAFLQWAGPAEQEPTRDR